MRIFGREPALWLAVIQAALGVLVGFQLDGLSAEQAAIWLSLTNALIAVVQALLTRPIAPTVFTNALAILATLGAAYGLDWGQELVASLNLLVVAVVTLIARGEISPAPDAHKTGVLGHKVTTGPPPATD